MEEINILYRKSITNISKDGQKMQTKMQLWPLLKSIQELNLYPLNSVMECSDIILRLRQRV